MHQIAHMLGLLALVAVSLPPTAAPAQEKTGSLIQPFEAPPLAELDAKAEWIDQPVQDGLELMSERKAKEKVLATDQEALALRNTSDASNAKILSALGRLPTSESEVNYEATITRNWRRDVPSTNPIMASAVEEFDLSGLIGIGFFSFDWNMRPFASKDTVVSWQSSKDGMYDKVVIRDDLTWSDGKPLTAHDVVFTFKTIMNEKIPIPAVRSGTDQLRWVEAYDDHTIVYFHKEPLATNIWNINFPIIPQHIYQDSIADDPTLVSSPYHVKFENNPVSGGPYTISKRTRDQDLILTRRESYYMQDGKQVRHKPHFKTIRFRILTNSDTGLLALKAGEIDEMELTPEQWQTQTNGNDFYSKNTKARGLEWVYFYFGWNNKSKFFSDARVRKAMSYAFYHEEMLDTLLYGLYEASTGPFHPTARMAPKKKLVPYQQDLDRAEDLLEAAGWTDSDGDGTLDKEINGRLVKFEFTILCGETPLAANVCSLLKDNLSQIGIICNVRPTDGVTLHEKLINHRFEANFGGWGTGADPDTMENLWKTDEGRNFVQYSNAKVDRLFEAGKRETNPAKRNAIYAQIHEQLYADQPYTWLFFRSSFYGFNKELRGYTFSPRGPFHYSPGFDAFWRASAQ